MESPLFDDSDINENRMTKNYITETVVASAGNE